MTGMSTVDHRCRRIAGTHARVLPRTRMAGDLAVAAKVLVVESKEVPGDRVRNLAVVSAVGLDEALRARAYPGRGVLMVRTVSGTRCLAYFLTGRSSASLQRELVVAAGGDVEVRDRRARRTPDELRHYTAVARRGDVIVVGNGSQVLPLAEDLAEGSEPLTAFARFDFEPDEPIFTPRIWIVTTVNETGPSVVGYAVRSGRPSSGADRVAWAASELAAGEGILMSTYDGTASRVSTARAPLDITTAAATPNELLGELWAALDPELRVAALAFDPSALPTEVEIAGRE
jgi:IMP cyclohydrolase